MEEFLSTKGYDIQKTLGQGSFGEVMLCIKGGDQCNENEKKKFAVKRVEIKNKIIFNALLTEIFILDILRTQCDEYVMCYVKSYIETPNVFIVCEYLDGYKKLSDLGEMEKIMGQTQLIKNIEILPYLFHHLLKGLEKIHSQNIFHRDIKPENIMFTTSGGNYNIKYIDFGLAAIFVNNFTKLNLETQCGTKYYMSNLLYEHKTYTPDLLRTIDEFALGMTMFTMLSKKQHMIKFYHDKEVFIEKKINQKVNLQDEDDIKEFNKIENLQKIINTKYFREIHELDSQIKQSAEEKNLYYKSFMDLLGLVKETTTTPIHIHKKSKTVETVMAAIPKLLAVTKPVTKPAVTKKSRYTLKNFFTRRPSQKTSQKKGGRSTNGNPSKRGGRVISNEK
jgi:serine/threonine protein kinase